VFKSILDLDQPTPLLKTETYICSVDMNKDSSFD